MTIESVDTDKKTAQLNMMKIIWLGILFYSCVIVFLAFKVLTFTEVTASNLETPFLVLAATLLILSRVIPKKLKNIFVGYIIALSLCEAVIMLGFVLVTITGEPRRILAFALAGILNIFLLYPRNAPTIS